MSYLSTMEMYFLLTILILSCMSCNGVAARRRHRREWLVPSKKLRENFDYKKSSPVARIRSDKDIDEPLYYVLKGPGADLKPFNRFMVDEKGMVYVTKVLDREDMDNYTLMGVAFFHNGTVAEDEIMLRFEVEDENDNPPVFPSVCPLSVNESSPPGTLVGTFTANDADKAGTLNARIAYSVVKQEPAEDRLHFYIDRYTGAIHVKENLLDRERQSSYTLTVMGVDMDGAPEGRSATGTVQIKVTDINDNTPTLEKDSYSAQIKENEADKEVLRIQALDNDEAPTTNWLAEFDIVTGNEDEIFSISTDPVTNEGILKLEKPVDFEQNPDIQLGVIVFNVAPFAGAGDGAGGGANAGGGGDGDSDGDGDGGGDGDMDFDIDADLGLDLDAGLGLGMGTGAGAGLDAGAEIGMGTGLDAGAGPGVGVGLDAGVNVGGGSTGGVGLNPPGANTGVAPNSGGGAGPTKKKKKKKKKRPVKGKVYAVNIAVENVIEGATFKPVVMPVQVSENPEELPEDRVIAVYKAISDDTGQPADNVIYAKDYDPDKLLIVNPDTAEIKLQKAPDRESPFVVNGTYYAKILSMTKDVPYSTSTGTLALQVRDFNDNCPTLTSILEYVCENTHVVNVTGHDKDGDPNGAPFSFRVVTEKTWGEWKVQPINGTHASLHSSTPFWIGEVHQIWLEVLDQQGLSCPEPLNLEVHVCSCEGVDSCGPAPGLLAKASFKESAATLGPQGVGVVILALLALLLAVFLATCGLGQKAEAFSEIPIFTEDNLMVYRTEGPGEDKDIPLLNSSVSAAPISPNFLCTTTTQANMSHTYRSHYTSTSTNFESRGRYDARDRTAEEVSHEERTHLMARRFRVDKTEGFIPPSIHPSSSAYPGPGRGGSSLSLDVFILGYCSQKVNHVTLKDSPPDELLVFNFEGQGSPAGSVSTCSFLGSNDDLHFLNDLELKFKTLAEICEPPCPPTWTIPPCTPTTPLAKPSTNLPVASIPPTFSTSRNTLLEAKADLTLQSKQSTILPQSSENSISSIQQTSSVQSEEKHKIVSQSIPQSPPAVVNGKLLQIQSAALAPPLGQHVLLQQPQQPIYYITSPVPMSMQYMVQPQIPNEIFLTGNQPANMHSLVMVQDGASGQVVHSGNPTWVMGSRRKHGSFDVGETLEWRKGTGRKRRRRSEGWSVSSDGHSNEILANNNKEDNISKAVHIDKKHQRSMFQGGSLDLAEPLEAKQSSYKSTRRRMSEGGVSADDYVNEMLANSKEATMIKKEQI